MSRLKHRFEDLDIRWTTTIEKEMLKLAGCESRMIEYLKRHRNTNRDTNPEWGTW